MSTFDLFTTEIGEIVVRCTLTAGDPLYTSPEVEWQLREMEEFDRQLAEEFAERKREHWGRLIGKTRRAKDVERGCTPVGVQDPFTILSNDQAAGMAEVIFAHHVGVCPTLQFDKYYHYNLQLPGGDRINVQWHKDGWAVLDQKREARRVAKKLDAPDIHVVLTGAINPRPRFFFAGWCYHHELLAGKEETLLSGPCWVLKRLRRQLQILTCPWGKGYRDPTRLDFEREP